jgi:cyclase
MKKAWKNAATALAMLAALVVVPAGAQPPVKTAEIAKRGWSAADFPKVIPLVPNIYAYEDVHIGGAITTNSLIVVTPEGVVVVDGQGTVAQTQRLVAEIGKLTDRPIRYVVMGSQHADHTGGNSAFPSSAVLVSHPVAQAALQRAAAQPPREGAPPTPAVVVPTETVADRRVLTLGGTEVEIRFLGRSHTGSDLTVYLPKQKVLFLSETYMPRMFPSMGTGYPTEWIAAVKQARRIKADWVVPAHGFVDDARSLKADLPVFQRALETIVAEGRRLHAAGIPVDDAAKQASFGEFNDWSLREVFGPVAIKRVYAELNGELK